MITLTSMPFLLSFDCPKLLSLHGPLPSALPYQPPLICPSHLQTPSSFTCPFPFICSFHSARYFSLSFKGHFHLFAITRGWFSQGIFFFSRTANILQLLHLFQSLVWQTCLTSHRTFWNSLVQDWYSSKPCLWFQSNVVGHPQPT